MGLKQDIVVRNEFTTKRSSGEGSRGSSVNKYITDYMARPEATEILTPVKIDGGVFDYATRYMARDSATEALQMDGGSVPELKHRFRNIDKLSGRTFGTGSLSFSHDELMDISKRIQEQYELGHAVLKPIISFDREYLLKTGLLPKGFVHQGNGSYRNNIDQAKLRAAVTSGMDRYLKAGKFVAPLWVASVQVDTSQLHIHSVVTDTKFSPQRMMPDGRDRGKINDREKNIIRRGINHALLELTALKSYHKQVDTERTNVVSYVKDFAYSEVNKNSGLQLLIASLPKDRKLWRYDSNDKRMKRSNEISEAIVDNLFKTKPKSSGYDRAIKSLKTYVAQKRKDDGLSLVERNNIFEKGEQDIVRRAVNGLYNTVKTIEDNRLLIRTPMLDVDSMSEDDIVSVISKASGPVEDDSAMFSLRVRGYNKRLDAHKKSTSVFHNYIDGFDQANEQGNVNIEAFVLRRFYEEELQYNMSLVDKYRKSFMYDDKKDRAAKKAMMPRYQELTQIYDSVNSRINLSNDVISGDVYEKIGIDEKDVTTDVQATDEKIKKVYGVNFGSFMFDPDTRWVMGEQLDDDAKRYTKMLRDYTYDCFDKGVATSREWQAITLPHRNIDDVDFGANLAYNNTAIVAPFPPRTRIENIDGPLFDRVKALDVHHLSLDFYGKVDTQISAANAEKFSEAYSWRKAFADATEDYLEATGQKLDVVDFVQNDLVDMADAVEVVSSTGIIPQVDTSAIDEIVDRNKFTIRLDDDIVDVVKAIHEVLERERVEQTEFLVNQLTNESYLPNDHTTID